MSQKHSGAPHSQGICLVPSSLGEGCSHVLCSSLHRSHILVLHHTGKESPWAFLSLTARGKGKHSAVCPTFSLTGFPRTSSCNSQSFLYNHQTGSHRHRVEWDKSLATEAGINECWACWSCVEGLAGQVLILFEQSLPNHCKHCKFAEICGWSHHMNIQNKWREKTLNLSTYKLLSKAQPWRLVLLAELPFASEQFDVNRHSPISLEKKFFPQSPLGATPGSLLGLGCGEVLISIIKLWKWNVYPP